MPTNKEIECSCSLSFKTWRGFRRHAKAARCRIILEAAATSQKRKRGDENEYLDVEQSPNTVEQEEPNSEDIDDLQVRMDFWLRLRLPLCWKSTCKQSL